MRLLNGFKKQMLSGFGALVFSIICFAQTIGQEVELVRYMNARYPNPDFRRTVNNIAGQLSTGTRARVVEVKRFRSGNSGFLLHILDGDLRERTLWVHYNPNNPSLRLFTADGAPTVQPPAAATGVTTREVPATADPVLDRAPASGGSVTPSAPPTPLPPPSEVTPVATPAPPAPTPDLAATIDRANQGVADMTAGGATGCRDCAVGAVAGDRATPAGGATVSSAAPTGYAAYFLNFDSLVPASGLSAARREAQLFMAWRARMTHYAVLCERYFAGSALMNAASSKWNALAPMIRRHNGAFPGRTNTQRMNAADTILTGYMNRTSLEMSSTDPHISSEQKCQTLRADFNKLLSLNEAEVLRFLGMSPQQRRQFLDAR